MAKADRASSEPDILARLERIAQVGYDVFRSDVTRGVTDISSPVIDHLGYAVSALTVPFLPQVGTTPKRATVMRLHAQAARRISEGIGGRGTLEK